MLEDGDWQLGLQVTKLVGNDLQVVLQALHVGFIDPRIRQIWPNSSACAGWLRCTFRLSLASGSGFGLATLLLQTLQMLCFLENPFQTFLFLCALSVILILGVRPELFMLSVPLGQGPPEGMT